MSLLLGLSSGRDAGGSGRVGGLVYNAEKGLGRGILVRISHRHHFIFFSNPKTGSESVRLMLDPYSDILCRRPSECTPDFPFYDHMLPVELREVFRQRGWDFDRYYKFVFVRNPWARLVSVYAAILDRGFAGRVRDARNVLSRWLRGRDLAPDVVGFREWVRTIETSGRGGGGKPHHRFRQKGTWSIAAFAGDGQGRELVDEVIRLEDAPRRLPELAARLGLPDADRIRLPHVNVHRHPKYVRYYDDATAAHVATLYAEDIARFGYRFGE